MARSSSNVERRDRVTSRVGLSSFTGRVVSMLLVTVLLILIEIAVAVSSPTRFVLLSLWVQTIPYTWNTDAQLVFDTPIGPLNVVAMQLFGFLLACVLIVFTKFDLVAAQFKNYRWHVVFLGFCVLSLSYAPSAAYGLRMIAKLLTPLLFLIVVLIGINTPQESAKLRNAIIGSGVILIVLALIARAAGIDSDPNAVQTGMAGLGPPSMGPPVFAAHMLPVAMLALASYLCVRRVWMLVFTVICAACVLAALQRTSAGALYIGFSVILFFGTRGIWRLLMPSVGLVGLPILLLFNDTFRRRMFFGTNGSQDLIDDPAKAFSKINTSGRSDLWATMLHKFFEPHPAVGSGIGATQDWLYTANGAGVAHSEYVRLLCEVGVSGVALFAFMALAYLLKLRKSVAKKLPVMQRLPALAGIGSLLTYLVYCSTDNSIDYVQQFGIYVFALVGVAIRANQLAIEKPFEAKSAQRTVLLFPNLLR